MTKKSRLKEIKDMLCGTEILSLKYEGVIGFDEKGNIISGGKKVGKVTKNNVKDILDEQFYDEFGYMPNSKSHMKALKQEFG